MRIGSASLEFDPDTARPGERLVCRVLLLATEPLDHAEAEIHLEMGNRVAVVCPLVIDERVERGVQTCLEGWMEIPESALWETVWLCGTVCHEGCSFPLGRREVPIHSRQAS